MAYRRKRRSLIRRRAVSRRRPISRRRSFRRRRTSSVRPIRIGFRRA